VAVTCEDTGAALFEVDLHDPEFRRVTRTMVEKGIWGEVETRSSEWSPLQVESKIRRQIEKRPQSATEKWAEVHRSRIELEGGALEARCGGGTSISRRSRRSSTGGRRSSDGGGLGGTVALALVSSVMITG